MSSLCPKCQHDSHVINSRQRDGTTNRRRECFRCKHRWNTIEVLEGDYRDPRMIPVRDQDIAALVNVTERIKKRMTP